MQLVTKQHFSALKLVLPYAGRLELIEYQNSFSDIFQGLKDTTPFTRDMIWFCRISLFTRVLTSMTIKHSCYELNDGVAKALEIIISQSFIHMQFPIRTIHLVLI